MKCIENYGNMDTKYNLKLYTFMWFLFNRSTFNTLRVISVYFYQHFGVTLYMCVHTYVYINVNIYMYIQESFD